jgi:Rieske 2Fe-2S family protein
LKSIACQVFHGLIFINLAENPADLVDGLSRVDASYGIYELENTKVACQETFPVAANWKLVLENFMECYHCAPAHAEYSQCHALKSPDDNAALRPAMLEDAARLGYKIDSIDNSQSSVDESVQYYYARNALYPPNVTGSKDGKPLAPLLGKIKEYGGGVADIQIGPVSFGIYYPDHAVLYRFVPRGVQQTDMDIIWLVHNQAQESKDYDLEDLTWMWRVTTEADKTIILNNQKGMNSRYYEPGCLSEMETYTSGFDQWYLAQIK